MTIFLTVLHVMVCLVLIVVVLLQRGKGAEIGAVFGGGGSSTVFGSRGAGNFLTKLTTGSAIVFMVTSLGLSALGTSSVSSGLFDESHDEIAPAPAAATEGSSPFAEPTQDGAVAPDAGKAPAAPEPSASASPSDAKTSDATKADGTPAKPAAD